MKRLILLIFLLSSLSAIAQTSQPRYELLTATGTDTYAVTVQQAQTVLVNGFSFRVKFTNANTGASTLNVNSSGAVALRQADGTALESGDIEAGTWRTVVYDGTASQWRLSGGGGGGGGGSGTVTSVAASVPSFLSVSGSPITSSGTLAFSLSGTALPTTSGGTGLTALGTAYQGLRINAGATALEYYTPTSNPTTNIGDIIQVTSTSGGVGVFGRLGIGTASQQLRVNAGATALEYFTPSSSSAMSSLSAASGTNTIDNTTYNQEWQWNSLTSATGLKLSSTSTAAASNTQKLLEVAQSGANATGSQTTHSLYITNTKSGTNASNIAGYFSASGATNNYSVYAPNGTAMFGPGTGFSTERLTVLGISGNNIIRLFNSGGTERFAFTDAGLLTQSPASRGSASNAVSTISGTWAPINGTFTSTHLALTPTYNSTGSYSGIAYGIDFNPTLTSTTGLTNIALRMTSGNLLMGTTLTHASAKVDIQSTTQGVVLPRMTKTQRDAISSPTTGLMVYQTDNTPGLRVWNGTNWMRYTETAD